MRKPSTKAIAGLAAFALPSLVAVVGMCLDRSRLRYNASYAASIPLMLWSSVILAAVVPGVLIMKSTLSLPRRIALTAAMLCLLALECGLTLYIVLTEALG